MSKIIALAVLIAILGVASISFVSHPSTPKPQSDPLNSQEDNENSGGLINQLHPLSIQSLREGDYPGSDIVIEQTLTPGSNYQRYIASYKSEGLKIYALLTVPNGTKPPSYIPPAQYRTTEKYIAYTDGFSRNGYIVFRSDYRGHGNSEGSASGGYGSNNYTIDILNAVASIKKYPDADPNRLGMWGHSMGGHITLRNMVVSPDVKAGVIWAGVVASYPDLLNNWRRRNPTPTGIISPFPGSRRWRDELVQNFGSPESNPEFWNSISANSYLSDISGPIQLHHGTADSSVPVAFSLKLEEQILAAGKTVELYTYEGDDHNISQNFSSAMQRSIEFFDKYVKNI